MTKVYELIYENYDNECGYYQVALSSDKDKLQAIIDRVKRIDDRYNNLFDENGVAKRVIKRLPIPLFLANIIEENNDDFDIDDFLLNYCGNCASYLKIIKRELL